MEALFMQAFERRDWVEGQMRQQVASFSESVICTLLAAGSRPRPWLLPRPADATGTRQGNTLIKPSLDLANLKRADGIHLALPKIHQLSEPETLEFGGVKPSSCNITGCSEVDNQCKNCVSETDYPEGPHSTALISAQNESSQLQSSLRKLSSEYDRAGTVVDACIVFSALSTSKRRLGKERVLDSSNCHLKESGHAEAKKLVRSEAFDGSVSNNMDRSVTPEVPEEVHLSANSSPGRSSASPPDDICSNSQSMKALLCIGITSSSNVSSVPQYPHSDSLENNLDIVSNSSHSRDKSMTPEVPEEVHLGANSSPGRSSASPSDVICNITSCSEVDNECKNCVSDTILTELTPVHPLNEDPSSTSFLGGPSSVASPLLENDSLQSVKPSFLEGIVSVPEPLPEKDTVQVHTTETDYPEGPHSTASLLLEKQAICSNEVNFLEGPPSICLLLAKEPAHTSELDSPEELHEKATSHDVRTSSLEGPHPMASLPCEKETVHTSEASFLEGPHCVASPLLESEPLYTVEHTEPLKNSYLNRSIDRCSMSYEQESSEFILPPSCYVSSSRPAAQLADTTSGDQEMLGMLQNNTPMLDDGYGCSPHPKENAMEDGGGHYSHSELDGALSTCSLHKSGDDNVYQNNIVSSGTISDNDPSSANALDALISAQNESSQMQSSVHKLSSEYYRTCTVVDTCTVFSVLFTSNKRLGKEPALDSANCHLKQSGPAEGKFFVRSEACDNMDKSVTPVVAQEVHLSANSSPGRSSASPSDVICSNSQSMKASLCIGSTPSSNVSLVPQYPQSDSLENNIDAVHHSSPSCSDALSDVDARCIRKAISCFKYPCADVRTATVEDKVVIETDYLAYESGVLNPENYPSTTSPTTFTSCALYQQNQQARASNESVLDKLNYDSNLEIDEKGIDDGLQVSDGAIPWENGDNYVNYDETVQQCQSFSITVPSSAKSPTIKERAFAGLCDSTKLVNLSINLSAKYKMDSKMKQLSGQCQSLAARFEKLISRCSINSAETKWHDPSYDISKLGVSGKYSSEHDGSFLMSNALSYDPANSISVQEDSEIPLTPSVEKYSLEKLSGRARSNSECMGSIPELACFQIDEDSSMAEENENGEILGRCPGRNYSSQGLSGKKTLEHVSSLYQSRENSASLSKRYVDVGRLGLKTTKVNTGKPDYHLHLSIDEAIKNPKENCAPSINKGKVSQPLHDRASRAGILSSKNIRNRSEANLEKGWKPSNIVNNMTSFVPLVKQKQKSSMGCVKKDVRVKALEAAEAAKRRQEKKQNERHMRKAAAKLERGRLKQEREQRQKQNEVEQKKKIDADAVTRKRQREDDEKKEKERKKKRAEEARKPEQRMERLHAANGEKDDCWKSSDDNEPRNDFVGVKHESIPDGRTEPVYSFIASENHNLKSVVADGRSESSRLQVQGSFSDDVDKSYEMSPYKDSDEEDGDDSEQEEVRRRKFIPSWSRDENLDKILLSNLSLDPTEIFARKCSFNLSDVLAIHIPQRHFS